MSGQNFSQIVLTIIKGREVGKELEEGFPIAILKYHEASDTFLRRSLKSLLLLGGLEEQTP